MNALDICSKHIAGMVQRALTIDPSDRFRDMRVERIRTALIFLDCDSNRFRPDFAEWLKNNFHVWESFEREANKVWDRGRRNYSARTIGEYIRHETAISECDSEFKINNNFFPDLGRLYACFYPQRTGFFETRSGVSAKRAL